MKKETIVKFIQKASNIKPTAVMAAGRDESIDTAFATPGSVFSKVDHILWAIAESKNNKIHLMKFVPIVKQLTKVLNGADASFIRHSEFYHDLKETLSKIEQQIAESKCRNKWTNKLMAKKDQKTLEEIEKHVDHLITRIVFAFAQRAKLMNIARSKKKQRTALEPIITSIAEEDESEVDTETASENSQDDTKEAER